MNLQLFVLLVEFTKLILQDSVLSATLVIHCAIAFSLCVWTHSANLIVFITQEKLTLLFWSQTQIIQHVSLL